MKRFAKYIVLAALIITVLVTACACGGNKGVIQPKPAEGAKTYEIEGNIVAEKIDEETLRVSCSTNLMAGTVVVLSIDSYEGERLEKMVYSMPDLAEGKGIFADFKIDPKWEGAITASLSVTPDEDGKQPDEVKEAYGTKLENLTGEHVLFNSKGNMICFQTEKIENY